MNETLETCIDDTATALEEQIEENLPEKESFSPDEELERLKSQISSLREELTALEEMKKHSERVLSEVNEFTMLFPEKSIDALPEEVWDQVRCGNSLAASFALYEKKRAYNEEKAMGVNKKNANLSAGMAGMNTSSEYFTMEQVRAMSRAEVKQNYSKIRESMKRWN